ncbi:MAG: winged helix-turn-helix transcriptional regulator [Candidatus Brocadiia bacterium]|jgi:DNA-binding MarR family transcriptional regulator
MDRHAYHTLQILDHVEKTPLLTNRRVASKLDVSVKLAHALVKQLVQKGMLDIRKHHARRWDYFLTPKGIAEKARLTYEFIDFTMQFYREARRRSSEVLAQARKSGVTRVAFLGASELAEIAYLGIQEQKLQLADVFDDALAGQKFLGLTVRPVSDLPLSAAEKVLVTAFDRTLPMDRHYLPPGVVPAAGNGEDLSHADPRLIWVFGAPQETPDQATESSSATHGEVRT